MNIDNQFPAGFFWGAATSGPQSEGAASKPHKNMFDYWYEKEPEAFFDRVGPEVTSDFYHTYREDLALLKETGMNSLRTSIQWTRLIKDLETGETDADGVRFYNEVIDEMIRNGITPMMNLHHFDLPVELYEKYGGWTSRHVVDLFVKFAKQCFMLFGDRVKYWITFNEPVVIVEGGYLSKFHYPKIVDGKQAVQVLYHLNLASAKAIAAYRETKQDGKIGIVLNLTPAYPRSESQGDKAAAEFCNNFYDNSFLYPAIRGEFPQELVSVLERDGVLWKGEPEDAAIIRKNTVDYLGVNYYQPKRVKERENPLSETDGWLPNRYFEDYEMPGRRMNPYRGWEIYPQAIYDIAIRVRDEFGNIPWYVSENGMGVEGEERFLDENGQICDDYRIEFLKEHLSYLHKGMEEGSNCFGYHMWTGIDCWSWTNAYKNRYGFVSLDLKTGKKRMKKSGKWFKEVVRTGSIV